MHEICELLGMPSFRATVGSSIPADFIDGILKALELELIGTSTEKAKTVVALAGGFWDEKCDSSSTPSGGGGTITLHGLQVLREAVTEVLEVQDAYDHSRVEPWLETNWTLLIGQEIRRTELHDHYGGIRQGGISPSRTSPNILLFTDDASNQSHGYERDHWITSDIFRYCADGQVGNQKLSNRNLSVFKHRESARKLRLFEGVRGTVRYVGEFEVDVQRPYEIVLGTGRDGKPRDAIMFNLRSVSTEPSGGIDPEVPSANFGVEYREASSELLDVTEIDPFTKDSRLLQESISVHMETQNQVANWLRKWGLSPLSPGLLEAPFDIGWEVEGARFIIEVKSIRLDNEVGQIRSGIGQVLEYAFEVRATPLLVTSRAPSDDKWGEVANLGGVRLLHLEELLSIDPHSLTRDQRSTSLT